LALVAAFSSLLRPLQLLPQQHTDTARHFLDANLPATAVFSQPKRCAGMTPKLKPLLLPQLVEERLGRRAEKHIVVNGASSVMASPDPADLSYVYYTTNSSASDIASPVTPIFSPRGHQRFSSSTSSLELPLQPPLPECPASPSQTSSTVSSLRPPLPDVEEEPVDRGGDTATLSDHFGLYSCLCQCFIPSTTDAAYADTLLTMVSSQVINHVLMIAAQRQSILAGVSRNSTSTTIWAFSVTPISLPTPVTLERSGVRPSLLSQSSHHG
jgi:hypothetical protein